MKKRRVRKLLANRLIFEALLVSGILLLSVTSNEVQAGDSGAEIIEKVREKYDKIIDATIAFTQKAKFSLSKAEYDSKGMLYMKKPNHYRIESDERTFVTDGKTVWSYSPANKQVLIDTYKEDERSFSPERFLLSAPKDFYAAILGKEKLQGRSVIVLKLTPKDDSSPTKSLKLWVDDSQWTLWKAEVIDRNENLTTYTVTEIRLNVSLADSTFNFIAPPGVEVVDLR
jgi:outer membrane lipoprotein carrier protein